MTCTHGKVRAVHAGITPLRIYGGWPGVKPKQLPDGKLKRLYLFHWDHMQCVMARPHDYAIYWGRWYEALCQLCDDYGLPQPATPLEVGHGGSK